MRRRSALTSDVLPLDGLRIFDLGAVWSGPYAGRLLAQLGARVIKVESPHRLDGTRPRSPDDCAGVFGDLNAGKLSTLLDLSDPSTAAQFRCMLTRVDGLIENFSPRVMSNFGLGPAALQSINSDLIAVSMPAFASAGAWSGYVGYGSSLELAAGLSHTELGLPPRPAPVPFTDYLAGCYAAAAFLAALIGRDAGRGGCHVEISQHAVARQLLNAPWRPRVAAQWEPEIWTCDAPPDLVGSECSPLGPHLLAPCWSVPVTPPPMRAMAVDAGSDTRTVLEDLLQD
jgi:crotonobetainyl-CoA:carnitine CoA-transferase CaiB-like acyl-CoA transferase